MSSTTINTSILVLIFFTLTNVMYSQDWQNLNRYQEQNFKLMDSIHKDSLTVFMGDSIIEGWINQRPEYFRNKGFINRGIGGQTTPQMLLRFQQDVIDLNPKAVVILAGINDIAGNTGPSTQKMIEDNIKSMCELARYNNIQVYLCSLLPAYDFPWRPGLEPAEKVISLNKFLKNLAIDKGLVYIDYYSEMVNDKGGLKSGLGEDGVHPNGEGYKIMERILDKNYNH